MNTNKIIYLIFPLFLFSCNHSRLEQKIEAFSNSHIELMLDSMLNGRPLNEMISITQSQFVYVSYVDSFACSSCNLAHISNWYYLTRDLKRTDFCNIYIIFPTKKDRNFIIEKIGRNLLDGKRVYIDTTGVFERHNPHLPKEQVLHTFLINKDRNVVLIGNPLESKRIENLFKRFVSKEMMYK